MSHPNSCTCFTCRTERREAAQPAPRTTPEAQDVHCCKCGKFLRQLAGTWKHVICEECYEKWVGDAPVAQPHKRTTVSTWGFSESIPVLPPEPKPASPVAQPQCFDCETVIPCACGNNRTKLYPGEMPEGANERPALPLSIPHRDGSRAAQAESPDYLRDHPPSPERLQQLKEEGGEAAAVPQTRTFKIAPMEMVAHGDFLHPKGEPCNLCAAPSPAGEHGLLYIAPYGYRFDCKCGESFHKEAKFNAHVRREMMREVTPDLDVCIAIVTGLIELYEGHLRVEHPERLRRVAHELERRLREQMKEEG